MTTTFVPYRNPETGLPHHVQPEITKIPAPESLLFVGNSLFFFNNGVHRFVRKLLAGADPKVACRTNLIAIGGASLYWHDLESYFRPDAIASYAIKNDGTNRLVWREPQKKLWDAVILCDSTQGPIHPDLRDRFIETAARDAAIARSHGTEPIFMITWAYADRPEMTEQIADAVLTVANANHAMAVPAGLAFAEAEKFAPTIPLTIEDKRHLTPEGSYLLAAVILESVFGVNVRRVSEDCDLTPETAMILREIAHKTAVRFFDRPLQSPSRKGSSGTKA